MDPDGTGRRMTPRDIPNVVLIGFMGTGKTAVGKMVASRLGRPFIDTDVLIEERAGRPIARIFAEDGEEAFRRFESEIVAEVSVRQGVVIATGGGVVLRPENMARLRQRGVIVGLQAHPQAILSRVGGGNDRPLLGTDPEASIRRLLLERARLYAHADLTIDTTDLPLRDAAERVLAFVAATRETGPGGAPAASGASTVDARTATAAPHAPGAPPRTSGAGSRSRAARDSAPVPEQIVRVDLGARGYDIRIGQAILNKAPEYLRACGIDGRLALLTHPRLDELYGRSLTASLRDAGYEIVTATVPPAESSKSMRVAQRVYDALVVALPSSRTT